jgi:hypothetical protein
MSAKLWPVSSVNGFTTTLNGAITASDDSLTLTSADGLSTSGGILVIDRINAAGTATPALREYISYTSITSSTLNGCTRALAGSTAQSHAAGSVIEEVWSVSHVLDLITFLEVSHNANGSLKDSTPITSAVLTTPVLTTSVSGTAVLDEDAMGSDSDTQLATQQSIKAYVDNQKTATSIASDTTPNPTGDARFNEYYLTALAGAAAFEAPSGTPVNGNKLLIRVLDNGTARALTYNAIYRAVGVDLPTTTTISKTLYMGFIYNSAASKWDLVASVEEG